MNSRDTWDSCASEYDNDAAKVTGPCVIKLLEQVSILPVASSAREIKVIDLAAGPGVLGTLIGKAYFDAGCLEKVSVLSTDFSPNMVKMAEHRFASHNWPSSQFSARTLDAMNLADVPSNHYTHAFCAFGLMMVPDAAKALGEMFRVLQPSGTIGITTWYKLGYVPLVSECIARAKASGDKQDNATSFLPVAGKWFEPSYVQKALEDAGFQNVQAKIVESQWSLTNQDEGVAQITKSWWINAMLQAVNLTDEQRAKYNQVAYQVLLDMVGKERDQPFDLPMIAIIAHGQKPNE